MVGTPAVAGAEPSTDDGVNSSVDGTSSGPSGTSATSGPGPLAGSPGPDASDNAEDSAGAAERDAVEGVESTVGSGRDPGDPALAQGGNSTESSTTEKPTATTTAEDVDPGAAAAEEEPATSDSDPSTGNTPGTTEAAGSGANPGAAGQAPNKTAAPPVNTPTAAPPATVPIAAYVMAVPYLALWGLQVVAPVSHVMAAVTFLLADVVVIPLLQLQRDLALLFTTAGVQPVVDSLARIGVALSPSVRDALAAKYGAPVHATTPLDAASIGGPENRAGTVSAVSTTSPVAAAPQKPDESAVSRVSSFIGDVTRKLLESPTLMALAIAALPGLAGLLVLTAGGVRLGYRQAKARVAIQVHGIARFVVTETAAGGRCGALVLLRPRAWSARELDVTSVLDDAA